MENLKLGTEILVENQPRGQITFATHGDGAFGSEQPRGTDNFGKENRPNFQKIINTSQTCWLVI
jgi:hypothetical protein